MLKDVVNKVKGEIDSERKNRESTEDTLLSLLEDTCSKLNTASLAWLIIILLNKKKIQKNIIYFLIIINYI